MMPMPILDGAPVFILLGFIMALAAYLRQVSVGALALIDNIKRRADAAFPYNEASASVRKEKLNSLTETRKQLAKLTFWMFFLMFLVAVRIILYAISRVAWVSPSGFDVFRYWFDLAIALAVLFLVCGMWCMHTKARNRDEEIRSQASESLGGACQRE